MSTPTAPIYNTKIGFGLAILSCFLIVGTIAYSSYFLTDVATDWSKIQSSTLPIFVVTILGTILIFASILWSLGVLSNTIVLLLLTAIATISVGMSYSSLLLTMLTKAA